MKTLKQNGIVQETELRRRVFRFLAHQPKNKNTICIQLYQLGVSDSGCLMSEFAPRVDLVAEAKNHIAFLNEVDKCSQLHESQVILNAIRRLVVFFFIK